MKYHMVLKKMTRKQFSFTFIFLFYLDFSTLKKPFPINIFDKKFKNSFGVILDDVIAGLYVVLTLIIFMIIKSQLF